MMTTVGDLMKVLQGIDPKTEVYFGSGNDENTYIETVPITRIEQGFVTHKSRRIEFSDTPPTGQMDINHPSWVSPAIRII